MASDQKHRSRSMQGTQRPQRPQSRNGQRLFCGLRGLCVQTPRRVLAQGLLCGLCALCVPTLLRVSALAQGPAVTDYVVGPQDVLTITSYDQADLSGKFAVEADGTFTYPLIGRLTAGGLSLRALEMRLNKRLKDEGFFNDPQVTVAVETYKSQKIFIVGEVRSPGTYPLSGDMNMVEALARAGSTLPTASGEAIIVHAGENASGPTLPTQDDATNVVH